MAGGAREGKPRRRQRQRQFSSAQFSWPPSDAVLSFISILRHPCPLIFRPIQKSTSSPQKGQQHKCRKFEWTNAVNEICKYFSKIELFWQIFSPMTRTTAKGRWQEAENGFGKRDCAGFMKISQENWFQVLWSAKTRSPNHWKMLWHIILTFPTPGLRRSFQRPSSLHSPPGSLD